MKELVLLPWFIEKGIEHIHPDDIEEVHDIMPYGKVFENKGLQDGYLLLQYGVRRIRVRPELVQDIGSIPISIGSQVNMNGTQALVVDIGWHFKRDMPFFLVSKNGKKSTRQYFLDELGNRMSSDQPN